MTVHANDSTGMSMDFRGRQWTVMSTDPGIEVRADTIIIPLTAQLSTEGDNVFLVRPQGFHSMCLILRIFAQGIIVRPTSGKCVIPACRHTHRWVLIA